MRNYKGALAALCLLFGFNGNASAGLIITDEQFSFELAGGFFDSSTNDIPLLVGTLFGSEYSGKTCTPNYVSICGVWGEAVSSEAHTDFLTSSGGALEFDSWHTYNQFDGFVPVFDRDLTMYYDPFVFMDDSFQFSGTMDVFALNVTSQLDFLATASMTQYGAFISVSAGTLNTPSPPEPPAEKVTAPASFGLFALSLLFLNRQKRHNK